MGVERVLFWVPDFGERAIGMWFCAAAVSNAFVLMTHPSFVWQTTLYLILSCTFVIFIMRTLVERYELFLRARATTKIAALVIISTLPVHAWMLASLLDLHPSWSCLMLQAIYVFAAWLVAFHVQSRYRLE